MNLKEYIEANYETVCEYAKSISSDPIDLVHHTYLKCLDKEAENPFAYFKTAMWRQAKTESFSKLYKYSTQSGEPLDASDEEEQEERLKEKLHAERIEFFLLNFDELDREIYKLWAEGWCMRTFSKESGIPERSIGHSLNKVREYLKEKL